MSPRTISLSLSPDHSQRLPTSLRDVALIIAFILQGTAAPSPHFLQGLVPLAVCLARRVTRPCISRQKYSQLLYFSGDM